MIEKKDTKNSEKTPFKDLEWICLKHAIRIILIIIFIVLSTILIFSVKNVVAITQDIDYTFDNDYLYNSDNDGLYFTNFNIRNQTIITPQDNYTATYDFRDEIGETGTDIDWVDSAGYDVEVVSEIASHKNVMNITADGTSGFVYDNFVGQTSGTVEFWMYIDNMGNNYWELYLHGNAGSAVWAIFTAGAKEIKFNDFGGAGWVVVNNYVDNTWYHYRIIFDCATDAYDVYINGVLEADDYGFMNLQTSIIRHQFGGWNVDNWDYIAIDAIGYSWDDNYSIGQNIENTQSTTTEILEVDKFTFNYESFLDNYDVGDDNPSTWIDIESGGDDDTNIALHPTDNSNRILLLEQYAPDTDDTGIEKEFEIESGILNISWSINFTEMSGTNEFCVKIYSYDETLISDIFIENTQLLYYHSGEHILDTGLTNDVIYDFNLYINYWNCISLLNYYADDIYQHTFIIPLIDCNKDGLGKIEFFIDVSVATNMILYLDNIGIYVNGSSISSEFAYLRSIALATNTWYFNENNLFSFNLTGNSSFHVSSYPYLHEISTLTEINSLDYYNGSYFFNIYDLLHETNSYCQYPMIWIEFYNQFQFYELNIEGVILTDGFNDYNLEYSHKYVDINQNYFYVDNNRLYFSLDLNESSYEGITGLFDIPNHSTINASIVYNSYYTGVINPYLCINYTDLTTLIGYYDFKSYYTTTRFLLPQNLYIDKIFINCSDFIPYAESYTNYINGQITGLIDSISLKFIRNIDYSITVITLISGFIPLIVMFTPSIALYSKFGKKILVPSLILMSIICIVGSLIPLWLFSLLIVIFGYLLLVSKYDEGI